VTSISADVAAFGHQLAQVPPSFITSGSTYDQPTVTTFGTQIPDASRSRVPGGRQPVAGRMLILSREFYHE
jgi:hypothetical protein